MVIVNTSFSPILYMRESVADKTPIPITIERRHTDPPGLWIAIVIASVALHSLLVWLMLSSKLNIVGRSSRSGARPLQVVEVVPTAKIRTKPRIIAQKPIQSTKPIQIKPIQVQPPQNQLSQPGTIAFTNKVTIKKPVNKSPLEKKATLTPPPAPKIESKKLNQKPKPDPTLTEKLRLQQLAEKRRLQQQAEQQRQQEIAEQLRQQEAERQRQKKLTQQQRQQELAEQLRQQEAERQHQQKLTQQQRQQELAEQLRQQKLAEQLRQEEIDAERRKREVATSQPTVPLGTPVEVPENAPAPFPTETPTSAPKPKPTSTPRQTSASTTTTADNTSTQGGGFWTASLNIPDEQAQQGLNARTTQIAILPKLIETNNTPKKFPILNEEDKKLVTKPIKLGVLLSIDANGQIFDPRKDFPGIKATCEPPGTPDLCQRYANKYFELNKANIKFIPAKDVGGIPAASQMLIELTIKPAVPDKKSPS